MAQQPQYVYVRAEPEQLSTQHQTVESSAGQHTHQQINVGAGYQTSSAGTRDPSQQVGPVTYDQEPLYEQSPEYTNGNVQQEIRYVQSTNNQEQQSVVPQQYIQYVPYIAPAP